MTDAPRSPSVALVGAGPGHPGLITLRAVECLRQADVVLYDRLVYPGLLDHAPATARFIAVESLPGGHPERYPLINAVMIDAARQGLRVVRLKGGDPSIFGRVGEEAEALRAAGISYEVVPGVTAGLGVAGCAGIPLTHRRFSSAVAFITGHEQPGKEGSLLDWAGIARFPGTLVFYMGIGRMQAIVQGLVEQGKPPTTPAAIVERGTTPTQRTLITTLGELADTVEREQVQAPALVILGDVVALHEQLAWFEERPLFGTSVVITRPAHQAAEFVRAVENLGGRALVLPTVEIDAPTDWSPVDECLAQLRSFDWIVFTSVNGVEYFFRRLLSSGRDLRSLGHVRFGVIGPATADALRTYHLEPDVIPTTYNSEGLIDALRDRVRSQKVLLARADRGLELLRDELSKVAEVRQVAVYSQRDATLSAEHPVMQQMREGKIDYITLTSSNIARVMIEAMDHSTRERIIRGEMGLICISPRTGDAVREFGLPVTAEAEEYTTTGVMEVLCRLAATRRNRGSS